METDHAIAAPSHSMSSESGFQEGEVHDQDSPEGGQVSNKQDSNDQSKAKNMEFLDNTLRMLEEYIEGSDEITEDGEDPKGGSPVLENRGEGVGDVVHLDGVCLTESADTATNSQRDADILLTEPEPTLTTKAPKSKLWGPTPDSPGKSRLATRVTSALNRLNFDQCQDPELCVGFLKTPSMKTYSALTKKLKTASPEWMQGFLDAGGLDLLLDAVDVLSSHRVKELSDAMLLVECVGCVRHVMNSRRGLNYVITDGDHARKLAMGLDTSNVVLKKQIMELFSALCVYSEEGFCVVLEALDHFKTKKKKVPTATLR